VENQTELVEVGDILSWTITVKNQGNLAVAFDPATIVDTIQYLDESDSYVNLTDASGKRVYAPWLKEELR